MWMDFGKKSFYFEQKGIKASYEIE